MNGCCFAEDKCPEAPLHDNCHCKAERIGNITVKADCPIIKFTGYIFNDYYKDGKAQIFNNLGYTISDSAFLKSEMEKQAYIAYSSGQYTLHKLDSFGQQINIQITLNGKNGMQISFKSGWMVYPDGKIVLITPYGGRIK